MPKPRKKSNKRVKRRLYIVCEGKETEPNYFKSLIKDLDFRGAPVEVQVIDTEKNTAKELIDEAKELKELDKDESWAVFDKDGYTKHPEAFENARNSNVRIAFSAISFEYWILLHFKYTTKSFSKSEGVIQEIESQGYINPFRKSDDIFSKTKDKIETAKTNARKLRQNLEQSDDLSKPYELGSFTNVDELIDALSELKKEYS